jgi:hypothetical protein
MTKDEKLKYVEEHYLVDAIQSIKKYRRYWNSTISRTLTDALNIKLKSSGYSTACFELPPQWEHVYYLLEDASLEYIDEMKK